MKYPKDRVVEEGAEMESQTPTSVCVLWVLLCAQAGLQVTT